MEKKKEEKKPYIFGYEEILIKDINIDSIRVKKDLHDDGVFHLYVEVIPSKYFKNKYEDIIFNNNNYNKIKEISLLLKDINERVLETVFKKKTRLVNKKELKPIIIHSVNSRREKWKKEDIENIFQILSSFGIYLNRKINVKYRFKKGNTKILNSDRFFQFFTLNQLPNYLINVNVHSYYLRG